MVERTGTICGIVGVIGRPTFKAKAVFKDLLQMDVVRGPHSTGIAAFGDSRAFVLKSTQLPQVLLENKKFISNVGTNFTDFHTMMGHNRLATQGRIVKRNAHPFHHGSVTLMHNGTLTTDLYCDGQKFETDSEGIAYSINKHGIEHTWKRMRGAAALAWWDSKDKTINLITNGQRPICIAYSTDEEQVIWASEKWMIEAAAERNKCQIKPIFSPKSNWLFQFSYDKDKKKVEGISTELEPVTYTPARNWPEHNSYRSHMNYENQNRRLDKSIHDHNPDNLPLSYIDDKMADKIAEAAAKNGEYSVDKTGNQGPVNLVNPGTSRRVGEHTTEIRYVSPDTHKYDPIKNAYVPKDMTDLLEGAKDEALDRLGDRIDAAQQRQKHKGGTLTLNKSNVLGHPVDEDLEKLQEKKMSEKKFHDTYKECMSCDESLGGDYEKAIVVSDYDAMCSKCVTSVLASGLGLNDIMISKK